MLTMTPASERLQLSSEVTDDHGEQVRFAETAEPAVKRNKHGVLGLRVAVMLAIVVVTAGIVVFGIDLKRRQTEHFHRNFYNDVKMMSETLWRKASTTLGVLDSFAASIVSATEATNQTWPFIQVPNFGLLASKAMTLTPLHFLALHPLVTEEEYDRFQTWTTQQNGWVGETMAIQQQDQNILDQEARYGELRDHTYVEVDWTSVNITSYVSSFYWQLPSSTNFHSRNNPEHQPMNKSL